MRKALVILLVLGGVLYFTNPDIGKHQRAVQRNMYKIVPQTYATDAATYLLAKEITSVRNYYLFSLTEVNYLGRRHIVGFGLLTKNYIL